jgi:8-oxo-dGTP diphosphatase
MLTYALGFLFSADRRRVLLIEKQRPDWQKGRWNGLGGKVEEGESAPQAMVRELHEEAGIQTSLADWHEVCTMRMPRFDVVVFAAQLSGSDAPIVHGDERVTWEEVANLPPRCLSNALWLVPLSVDRLTGGAFQPFIIPYPEPGSR